MKSYTDHKNRNRSSLPPWWADRFLEWYCAPDLLEEVQGDLYETYNRNFKTGNSNQARRQFIWNVIRFFNYSTITGNKQFSKIYKPAVMLKNYLTLSFRNLLRYKFYSFLNISGLVVGIASFILIALYVLDEWSYDRFNQKADRIYRITVENFNNDGEKVRHWVASSPGFAPLLKEDFADIRESVRFFLWDTPVLSVGDRKIVEENMAYAEPSIFQIFSFQLLQGNPETALNDPNSLILTETAAVKYFGSGWKEQSLLGKEILYNNEMPMKITGIMKDIPPQSHLHFDVLGSFAAVENYFGEEEVRDVVGNFNYPSYVLVSDHTDIDDLNSKMFEFGKKYIPVINGREFFKIFQIKLEPLTDIHLRSNTTTEYSDNGNISSIYIFSISGILILLIACINYMNLTTAKYSRRMREVGIRKVMGAYRSQLIQQFLTEAVFFALISLMLALIFVWVFIPYLNDFSGKSLGLLVMDKMYFLYLGLILIGVGLISGSYPAFYLSRFKPSQILGSKLKTRGYKSFPRTVLVIFQFIISIILIICVGVVGDQMNYIKNKNLGYSGHQIFSFRSNAYIREHWESFKNEIYTLPGVKKVTASSRIPTGQLSDSFTGYIIKDNEPQPVDFRLAMIRIDPDFFDTYEIDLVAGRNFDDSRIADSLGAFILNAMAIEKLGWENPDAAIGQPFRYGNQTGRIIGVVSDFHFESLHTAIAPMIFYQQLLSYRQVSVKVDMNYFPEIISAIENKWGDIEPDYPFNYQFVDEAYQARYAKEEKLGILFRIFSGLALVIGCLGLFGLVGFVTEYRAKEISIRKVMGASISNILGMVTGQYSRLILIAFIIAIPASWYFMDLWLDRFAYHTRIRISTIFLAGSITFLIALVTISYQSIKAALSNPVDQLRTE
jgi:putative ABC transport system permease protein